jgi:hypothetical protein
MKQEQEETTIKELFQQLKQEDERGAPAFADSWGAAQSRMEERGQDFRARASNPIARRPLAHSWSWRRWSFAAAAAILIACGFIVIVFHTNQNGSGKDRVVITERAPEPRPPVEREPQIKKGPINREPRRESRTMRPRRGSRPRPNTPSIRVETITAELEESENLTDFLLLRYGDDHEPMESGEVIRVQMPRSALISLGLPVNVEHADEPVLADLLIGEDGLARAIRFVR